MEHVTERGDFHHFPKRTWPVCMETNSQTLYKYQEKQNKNNNKKNKKKKQKKKHITIRQFNTIYAPA